MGCSSCGGGGAASRVGSTLNTALVFGEPTPDVVRARVTGDIPGLQVGAIKYVRGTNIDRLVEDGKLALMAGAPRTIPPRPGGTTLYYVGTVGYPDLPSARVRSGQTGDDIIVRTIG